MPSRQVYALILKRTLVAVLVVLVCVFLALCRWIGDLPTEGEISAYAFTDASHGWLAVGKSILATSDGGLRWTRRAEAPDWVSQLDFVSPTRGWAVVQNRQGVRADGSVRSLPYDRESLWMTQDGGRSWRQVSTTDDTRFGRVRFVDELNGWSWDMGGPKRTADGGLTWQPVASPCNPPLGAVTYSFSSPLHGHIICAHLGKGRYYQQLDFVTHDSGQTWELLSDFSGTVMRLSPITGAFFIDELQGWATRSSSSSPMAGLSVTEDGGRVWRQATSAVLYGAGWHEPRFLSVSDGYVLEWAGDGSYRLLATRDGGATWKDLYRTERPRELPTRPPAAQAYR